ncbi:hypothetical protein ACTMTI_52115 [Nonomuraea sp. H19]|uniref:hypothetical protein n=1 Tax=Nonomuraea sp. H19 TaxID=3452206 RepID=UPI003F887C63
MIGRDGLELVDQVLQRLLAAGNSREDDRADRIVGMAEGGVGDLEQDVLLPSHPLERIDQLLGHLAVGPRLDPMHGGDQQLHERVGDLPLAFVDQRRQQQDRELARVGAHV